MRTSRRSHGATLQKVQVILKSTSRTALELSSRAPTRPVGRCGCSGSGRTASSAKATATRNPSGYFENYGTCWNAEKATLFCPPLTLEPSAAAVLLAPPMTLALSPLAVFCRPPLTLEATAVVMFSCPPLMLEVPPLAVLFKPPETVSALAIAWLPVPPVTLEKSPLATFRTPAANAETPSSVLAAPAARPPCLVKLCCPPTMRLCDPVRLTASVCCSSYPTIRLPRPVSVLLSSVLPLPLRTWTLAPLELMCGA